MKDRRKVKIELNTVTAICLIIAVLVSCISDYYKDKRIRKLTPRECWRLQGFPDWAFDKAQAVNSNSQLYKQAGNSVTVNVIEAIARRLK